MSRRGKMGTRRMKGVVEEEKRGRGGRRRSGRRTKMKRMRTRRNKNGRR